MPNTLRAQFDDLPEKLEIRHRLLSMLAGGARTTINRPQNIIVIDIINMLPEKIDAIRRQIQLWNGRILE